MTIAHLLVDFSAFPSEVSDPFATDAASDENQLEAFEQGYQAGWDDSAKAHAEESQRVSQELAATLQDWSFTFRDAQTQLLTSLKPLFQQISDTLLPALAQTGTPHLLADQLTELARQHVGETVTLRLSGHDLPLVEDILQNYASFSVDLKADLTLRAGEFQISSGTEERFVDTNQVITSVQEALNAMTTNLERTGTNEA